MQCLAVAGHLNQQTIAATPGHKADYYRYASSSNRHDLAYVTV
jgi:hypothetical protein